MVGSRKILWGSCVLVLAGCGDGVGPQPPMLQDCAGESCVGGVSPPTKGQGSSGSGRPDASSPVPTPDADAAIESGVDGSQCPRTTPSDGSPCDPNVNPTPCSYGALTCFCSAYWLCF